MDDFGTGYSSLSYLRSFPFDKIKIDQSFVRDLGANRDAQAIVRSIISLGKGLGVTITAEGLETEAELSCLRAEGCHEGQGFLFSRARPNAEIVGLLQAQCGADFVAPAERGCARRLTISARRARPCACSDGRSAPARRNGAAPVREASSFAFKRMLRLPP